MNRKIEKIYRLSVYADQNFVITETLITIKGNSLPNLFFSTEQIDKFVAQHGLPEMDYYPQEIIRTK